MDMKVSRNQPKDGTLSRTGRPQADRRAGKNSNMPRQRRVAFERLTDALLLSMFGRLACGYLPEALGNACTELPFTCSLVERAATRRSLAQAGQCLKP